MLAASYHIPYILEWDESAFRSSAHARRDTWIPSSLTDNGATISLKQPHGWQLLLDAGKLAVFSIHTDSSVTQNMIGTFRLKWETSFINLITFMLVMLLDTAYFFDFLYNLSYLNKVKHFQLHVSLILLKDFFLTKNYDSKTTDLATQHSVRWTTSQ